MPVLQASTPALVQMTALFAKVPCTVWNATNFFQV